MSVLDASAVLAFLLEEAGREQVLEAMLAGAEMTTANFAEVATKYVLRGALDEAQGLRVKLPVTLVPVDDDLAMRAALMAGATRRVGLSLGDRLCLALAQRTGASAVTADRSWAQVAAEIGVDVRVIR